MIDFHVKADLRDEAKRLGYSDIGVIGADSGLRGALIDAKDERVLRDRAKSAKADYTLYLSHDAKLARSCPADVLCLDFERLVYDTVIGKSADFVEFDLHSVIFSKTGVRAASCFEKALRIARRCKNRIIVSTRPENRYQLRSPRDIECLLAVLGMTEEEASAAVSKNPAELLKKIRGKKKRIAKGVSDSG
ncbi:MAG: RNase P subunit p30 family protein [archaeon]